MMVALYVGDHAADSLLVRVGMALTRLAQKGAYGVVTHVEAILERHPDGTVDIASASLREGGVRRRYRVQLDPENWLIADVPGWDTQAAAAWFDEHQGEPYDSRGALATVLPGHHRSGQWFCNEALGACVGLREPHTFGPHQFAALCMSLGRDVTREFFGCAPTT